MSSTPTQANRLLSIETPLGDDVLLITGFSAAERISSPFEYEVEMVADVTKASSVSADALVAKKVAISLAQNDDYENAPRRYFSGIISRFIHGHSTTRFVHYRARVVPWLWLLTQTSDCRIFQNVTVLDIVKKIFSELKESFPELVSYRDATEGEYIKLDYCVQYRETDFDFVSRLLEQEGIFYFFEHERDKHTLVLADSQGAHKPCPGQPAARYVPEGGWGDFDNPVVSWELDHQMLSGLYTMRDFHFQMPGKSLEVAEPAKIKIGGNARLEIFDFPGEYAQRFNKPDERLSQVESEGAKLVKLRMEEEESPYQEANGASFCRGFAAGYRFELTDHYDRKMDGHYVLTLVQHTAVQNPSYVSEEAGEGGVDPYQNSFTCIPRAIAFRPSRTMPKPVIPGPQTAVVVGPPGEEIYTDKYGRVKVQFPWDRLGERDEKSSCWLRVSQPWAGKSWGAVWIPRIGQEVIVDFLEGDPDQPIITGRVYNADQMPPYELPAKQTQSGFKSRSSKGGGTANFNEIRFEDKKGKEEIHVHAERNLSTVVEASESRSVGGSRSTTIQKKETLVIKEDDREETLEQGNDKLTIQMGNRECTILQGNDTLTLTTGNIDVTAPAGKYTLLANQVVIQGMVDVTLLCGASLVKMTPAMITITSPMVKIN
jgi:type VI secretion system secreted protein VgrG